MVCLSFRKQSHTFASYFGGFLNMWENIHLTHLGSAHRVLVPRNSLLFLWQSLPGRSNCIASFLLFSSFFLKSSCSVSSCSPHSAPFCLSAFSIFNQQRSVEWVITWCKYAGKEGECAFITEELSFMSSHALPLFRCGEEFVKERAEKLRGYVCKICLGVFLACRLSQ